MAEELILMPRTTQTTTPTMRDLAAVIFRQRRVMIVSFVLIFAGVLAYGLLSPGYEAEMKILVRRGRLDPVLTPAPTPPPEFVRDQVTEEELNSEAELLRDRDILRTVVEKDHLTTSQGWLSRFSGISSQAPVERAIRRLDQRLTIDPVKKATLIRVRYRSSSPQKAAAVLQTLASAYLERHQQVRRPSGEFQFFDQQAQLARQALQQAELQLMTYDRDEGIVSASLERDETIQKLSDAAETELKTRVELAETAQRIKSLESKIPSLPERTTTEIRNLDNPELMGKLKARLLELQLQRTELLTKFQPSYRLVQEVDQQIAETKTAIATEDQTPLRDETTALDPDRQWAKSELIKAQVQFTTLAARATATATMLASYRQTAAQLGDRAIKQDELMRDFKTAEDKYLLYVNKREEARIGDALDQRGILNVMIAEPPTVPALPMRSEWSYAAIGLALAGSCSTGLAFAADRLDPAFRTPDEVLAYLGAPVLASLPRQSS
jgi:protein tyrosine kinase modulator